MSVESMVAVDGFPIEASAYTVYSSGLYAGAHQYSVIRYVRQGIDSYLIQLDRQHGYPDELLVDAVVNAANLRDAPTSRASARPPPLGHIEGVLVRAQFMDRSSSGPPGPWAASEDMDCPEVVVNGFPYSIAIEHQLPNVQPTGLVVLLGGGAPTTIPWGAHVAVSVDTFTKASASTSIGCGTDPGKVTFANAVAVTPSP
jgi:hypothetical protein